MTKRFAGLLSFAILIVLSAMVFGERSLMAAESIEADFKKANELYRGKKFADAQKIYEDIAKVHPNAETFYNLGNVNIRLRKTGLAILNFERARKLAPRDRDIIANLEYSQRMIEYEIKDKSNWYAKQVKKLLQALTVDECWFIALCGYFLFISGIFIELLRNKKPVFGVTGLVALSLVIICSLPIGLKFSALGSVNRAIVIQPEAEVRYGPSSSDRLAFRLVEGLKVTVKAQSDDWYLIELDDRQSGWLPKSEVVLI